MLKRLLITVKTYPAISTKYQEIVCTAGVDLTSDPKRFIRIYPIPFRKLPYSKQYKKYEIWEFQVKKAEKDHRIDNFHLIDPKVGGTKVDYISTGKNRDWQDRKQIILPLLAKSMCDLQGNYKAFPKTAPTLGLIKPCDVEFIVEPDEREWDEKKKTIIAQAKLFEDDEITPLEKIPYKFSYKFRCSHPQCKGHKMLINDWEVYQLWRSCRDRAKLSGKSQLEAEEEAVQKVIEKYQGWMLKRDLYFYVGTVHKHGTWIIIGLFYPPL